MMASSASVSATGARDDQLGVGQGGRHIVDEVPHLHPLAVAERRVVDLHPVVLVGPGLVHDRRQPPARIQHAHHARGELVDGVRALAAAQNQDRPPAHGVRPANGGRAFDQRAAHRIAGEADLAAGERPRASSKATNTRRANRPSIRLVKPGTLYFLNSVGYPDSAAVKTSGPEA